MDGREAGKKSSAQNKSFLRSARRCATWKAGPITHVPVAPYTLHVALTSTSLIIMIRSSSFTWNSYAREPKWSKMLPKLSPRPCRISILSSTERTSVSAVLKRKLNSHAQFINYHHDTLFPRESSIENPYVCYCFKNLGRSLASFFPLLSRERERPTVLRNCVNLHDQIPMKNLKQELDILGKAYLQDSFFSTTSFHVAHRQSVSRRRWHTKECQIPEPRLTTSVFAPKIEPLAEADDRVRFMSIFVNISAHASFRSLEFCGSQLTRNQDDSLKQAPGCAGLKQQKPELDLTLKHWNASQTDDHPDRLHHEIFPCNIQELVLPPCLTLQRRTSQSTTPISKVSHLMLLGFFVSIRPQDMRHGTKGFFGGRTSRNLKVAFRERTLPHHVQTDQLMSLWSRTIFIATSFWNTALMNEPRVCSLMATSKRPIP